MIKKYFNFLDKNQWACWLGLAAGILIVGAIEQSTFPFNL